MFRCLLLMLLFTSCQNATIIDTGSKNELEVALKNNDTASAKIITQRELDKIRTSIKDSSFAALIDASLELENLELIIQKDDSSALEQQYLTKLHIILWRVYNYALLRSIQKSDIAYYIAKCNINSENWIKDNFMNKEKNQLQVNLLLLKQDVAIASGIINGVDSKEGRKEIEESYKNSIRILQENN